jgi:toxin ParE1/3/4
MKLRWATDAVTQLENIHDYIALDKPVAAAKTVHRILRAAEMLGQHPGLGKPGRGGEEMREFVKSPFILVYSVVQDVVTIEAVFHGNPC